MNFDTIKETEMNQEAPNTTGINYPDTESYPNPIPPEGHCTLTTDNRCTSMTFSRPYESDGDENRKSGDTSIVIKPDEEPRTGNGFLRRIVMCSLMMAMVSFSLTTEVFAVIITTFWAFPSFFTSNFGTGLYTKPMKCRWKRSRY